MKHYLTTGLFIGLFTLTQGALAMSDRSIAIRNLEQPKTLQAVKEYAKGEWKSISIELRPTEDRAGQGKITPTYLTRHFSFVGNDTFNGAITMYADNYGKFPLMKFEFKGQLIWGDVHPIADGAWEIDYVLDQGFALTPLNDQAAEMLNQLPADGVVPFKSNVTQDILKKPFPMFNIVKEQVVTDYDLIYFTHGMLFMGAKHVDGRAFDRAENRPHQLQIPLVRVND